MRQREIPQLAPDCGNLPIEKLALTSCLKVHRKARAKKDGWAGLREIPPRPQPLGWEQNFGDSEKGREQQEVT